MMLCWHHKKVSNTAPITPIASLGPPVTTGVSEVGLWENPRSEFGAVPGVQCAAENPWAVLQTTDRKMMLGEYNEAEPSVEQWRVKQMENAKLQFCTKQIEWAWEQSLPEKRPAWRKVLASPLLNAHIADNHPEDSPVKFCVSFWDVSAGDALWTEMIANGWNADDVRNSWREFAHAVASRYMHRANYLRIDGKPVLMRGYVESLRWYERTFGITPQEIDSIIRSEIKAFTGVEPYMIATCTDYETWPLLKEWGYQAVTQYDLEGEGWDAALSAHHYWWATGLQYARETGLHFWISAMAGYDSTAWGSPKGVTIVCEPTPEQFTAHLREARKVAADNYALTHGMVLTYAWNEIGEGGCLEPMADIEGNLHRGDEMIRAHAEACRQ